MSPQTETKASVGFKAGVKEKELVFKEVLPHTSKLMTDVFGNYVIQKVCFEVMYIVIN